MQVQAHVKSEVLGVPNKGLNAVDFETGRIDIEELYSGLTELPVKGTDVDTFYSQGALPLTTADMAADNIGDGEEPILPAGAVVVVLGDAGAFFFNGVLLFQASQTSLHFFSGNITSCARH